MYDLFLKSGLWAWLILMLEFVLVPLGLVVLFFMKTRRARVTFLFLSLLPVITGGIGSYIGFQRIQDAIATETLPSEVILAAEEAAKAPLLLGGWFSLPLVVIALAGLAMLYYKSDRGQN